jgi:hypothetical protein
MKTLRALIRASLTSRSSTGTAPAMKACGFQQVRARAQLAVMQYYIVLDKYFS